VMTRGPWFQPDQHRRTSSQKSLASASQLGLEERSGHGVASLCRSSRGRMATLARIHLVTTFALIPPTLPLPGSSPRLGIRVRSTCTSGV